MNTKTEKEIIEKVITAINDLYPPKAPRVDLSLPSFDMPSAEIIITLFEHENMPYTDVSLLIGTSKSKQKVNIGNLLASNCLSLSALKMLIDYILINFPIVLSISANTNSISIYFTFSKDAELFNTPGLSLENLTLEINTQDAKLQSNLKDYLIFIVNTYTKEISETSFWKDNFNKYAYFYKKEVLSQMNYEKLLELASSLSEDELRNILLNIENDRFIELTNSKETILIRSLPKG